MKKSILLIIGILVAVTTLFAGDKYNEAMEKGLEQLSEAKNKEAYLEVSNTFARIAAVEQDKWLPSYYAAYSVTMYAAMQDDMNAKDNYLDKAEDFLKIASQVDGKNVEIITLQSFIHLLRIAVDPQSRGQEFSTKSAALLAKARELEPGNPRVMLFTAQLNYGTAQFFGQDGSEACKLNVQAIQMFDTYTSDIPFYPDWGKNMALGFQERCK